MDSYRVVQSVVALILRDIRHNFIFEMLLYSRIQSLRLFNPCKMRLLLIFLLWFSAKVPTLVTAQDTTECIFAAEDPEICELVLFVEQDPPVPLISEEVSAHLEAIAAKTVEKVYPPRPKALKALKRYDELPYPIPVGPSLYFCSLFLILLTWYVKKIIWRSLHRTAEKIELYPDANQFPKIQLYSLQQSKREARLRREARNTWAWMSNKYLLMPNDPKVNTSVFRTTWSDFDLPKDVWGIVRAVMKVNAWFGRSKQRIDAGAPLPVPPKKSVIAKGTTTTNKQESTEAAPVGLPKLHQLTSRLLELRKATAIENLNKDTTPSDLKLTSGLLVKRTTSAPSKRASKLVANAAPSEFTIVEVADAGTGTSLAPIQSRTSPQHD